MSGNISVGMLGVGAFYLQIENRRIFVDAFNENIPSPEIKSDDIIIFTHTDNDHFSLKGIIENCKNNVIVGPPSMAYPILSSGLIDPEKLIIMYPEVVDKPSHYDEGEIGISMYQTKHFGDWNPIHVSYLINVGGKRIYITGDSTLNRNTPHLYQNLDCIIYNVVSKDVVEGKMSSEIGAIYHLNEITDMKYRYNPGKIVCTHLLDCSWTVNIDEMEACLIRNNVKDVYIPKDKDSTIVI